MEIDKLTEQILEITNNSDYGWIDLDSADADRIRVALTQAMNYIPCCTELNDDIKFERKSSARVFNNEKGIWEFI